jgi:hypothetical protein
MLSDKNGGINMNHKLIEELLQNPMYVMSLHGKELFHSNFWGWLFEHDIAYAQIFFPEINTDARSDRGV